jgi:integral membrane protein
VDAWLGWRLVKFVGLALYAGGVFSLVGRGDRAGRLAALDRLLTPGLLLTAFAGYGLMKSSGGTFEPWILTSLAAAALGFHGAVGHAFAPRRTQAALALAGFVGGLVVMVLRPEGANAALIAAAAGALGAALLGGLVAADDGGAADDALARAWFRHLAVAEGISLILLMVIGMPLKYGWGIHLDGGTGALGWAHGLLFLMYVRAVAAMAPRMGWSWQWALAGFVASLVPFGTFVFERRAPAGR